MSQINAVNFCLKS